MGDGRGLAFLTTDNWQLTTFPLHSSQPRARPWGPAFANEPRACSAPCAPQAPRRPYRRHESKAGVRLGEPYQAASSTRLYSPRPQGMPSTGDNAIPPNSVHGKLRFASAAHRGQLEDQWNPVIPLDRPSCPNLTTSPQTHPSPRPGCRKARHPPGPPPFLAPCGIGGLPTRRFRILRHGFG